MREVQLTQGYKAQVDDEDYERVNQYLWQADVARRKDGTIWNVYAIRQVKLESGKRTTQKMHRFIMSAFDPKVGVDHNPDISGLNNQKNNLRLSTQQQNVASQALGIKNTSGYKGVYWYDPLQKWAAHIKVNYKLKHLGYFTDIKEAAQAYDAAAFKLFGKFAKPNFNQQI